MSAVVKRFLSRAELLGLSDLKTNELFIPEWDCHVRIRALTAAERDKFEADSVKRKGKHFEPNVVNLRARLCVLTLVDENNCRLFADEDAEELGAKNAAAVNLIFEESRKLSGMSKEDVEELEKNSESEPNDDSPSD